ncbi:tripartite tricarboxylate transporter permease [Salipaludibacillus aurantiacus]|uniref:Putative tricarboxylic transport membrane protein n=1 Tax=Salipaludibacillus aurantiacus TaxID=1601833 RepID=A0A1H9UPX3_9BACI|nr:tripartite tricarboxylate transporter permease [Salipaludibacillus aurantiacus]SES11580.1 putative tricarboxylic transport membrane protein [Salipaludibacillus aurantiacus]
MEFLLVGLEETLNITTILIIAGSVFLGIFFGAIPGLTASLGIALLLPFTFGLGPVNGLAALLGMYVGATSGGMISATLIGIPGTGASIVTTFDGYPMAQQGKANRALSLGVFASLVGGVISMILLTFIAPLLARVALMFGPWEYFALGIFGLTIVVSVSSNNMLKGLIAACLGVFITMIGQDPVVATPRFTFGFGQLEGGFSLLPTLLGFFAISRFFMDVSTTDKLAPAITLDNKYKVFPPLGDIKKSIRNLVRSSFIGTWIGILPGAGGSIASFLAYDRARKASKTPEKFGTGHSEGVIASESSNNSVTGGALIPLMTLGIPGDMVTAVILGGLLIHGLQPGPMLFSNNAEIVGSIFIGLLFATILMFIIQSGLMRYFAKIIKVPKHILLPVIIVMSMVGTFSANNRIFDLWVLIIFGFIGYILIKNKFDLAPLILGYILGPIIEKNWRLGLMATNGDYLPFVTRPVSVLLLTVAVLSILYPIYKSKRAAKKSA